MVAFYVQWLEEICEIPKRRIHFSLYVHESKIEELKEIKKFWMNQLQYPEEALRAVYLKKKNKYDKKEYRYLVLWNDES